MRIMKKQETFLWYDLETFGLNPRYDRIAQFAAVRTDTNLEVIGEPILLYCRLSDDYLVDPLSVLITEITPYEVNEKGVSEREFAKKIYETMSVPNTCSVGYNTIRFDDEFIRNLFFRNFFDPYKREYENGNSRWDIIDLVRAARDLRPEGVVWPTKESGKPSFKLTDLTSANSISHEGAHDALSDVWATLELARLIKKKQPKLFHYYLKLRNKNFAKEMLLPPLREPLLLTAAPFTKEQGCSTVILPITVSSTNANNVVVFDLMQDPSSLISANATYSEVEYFKEKEESFASLIQRANSALESEQNLATLLGEAVEHLKEASSLFSSLPRLMQGATQLSKERGVYQIAMNRLPFLSPLSVLSDEVSQRLQIDLEVCEKHKEMLLAEDSLATNLRKSIDLQEYPTVHDVDFTLYSGPFFNPADSLLFSQIRESEADRLWETKFEFHDLRAHEMLWRYLCRNWPEELQGERLNKWRSFCANRLLNPPGDTIVTLSFFSRTIEEKLQSKETAPEQKEVLTSLVHWAKEVCERVGLEYPN